MANVLDMLLKTIEEVKGKNAKDPRVETADPSIFDLLRKEVNKLDQKIQTKQVQKGRKQPKSIFDMIKDGIDGVRKENKKDPKVPTADKSIFDQLLKKVQQGPQRQASSGIKKIVEDYHLDVSQVPREVLQQVQQQYHKDFEGLRKNYATAIYNMTKQYR